MTGVGYELILAWAHLVSNTIEIRAYYHDYYEPNENY